MVYSGLAFIGFVYSAIRETAESKEKHPPVPK